MAITFITLRRRSATLLKEIVLLPRSVWRTVELDVPTRKYKTPRVYEQTVRLEGEVFRQVSIRDLGHDEPTILLTNDRRTSTPRLITRYAQRMLASGLYRVLARRMRGYRDAQARQVFRDLIDTPATVTVGEKEILIHFHRRAHLPIILASGLLDRSVKVPWWNGRHLRLTA